mgnify:CR=1 FL=1
MRKSDDIYISSVDVCHTESPRVGIETSAGQRGGGGFSGGHRGCARRPGGEARVAADGGDHRHAVTATRRCTLAEILRWVARRGSNCVESQAVLMFVKLGFHGVLDLKIAFMMESSLCMQATKTTFLGLSFSRRR